MTSETEFVKLPFLAERWKVSIPTARARTKSPGFPLELELGPRSLRWPLEEVIKWEQNKRVERARHRVTKTLPQFRRAELPKPARTRVIVSRA
ncbi:MAG TPA: hypothetical protein VGD03_07465 [Frankiaceae bacterium]|jgi:predicted DNA-binding transcriptional regulator AlpA